MPRWPSGTAPALRAGSHSGSGVRISPVAPLYNMKWNIITNFVSDFNSSGRSYYKKRNFKHSTSNKRYFPCIHDDENNVFYSTMILNINDHYSLHRIEKRNNAFYIYIADKRLRELYIGKNRNGLLKVKLFATGSMPFLYAASVHMEDKIKYLMRSGVTFIKGTWLPWDSDVIIDALLTPEFKNFDETFIFGSGKKFGSIKYQKIRIKRIKFSEMKCHMIVQGGSDHYKLFKYALSVNREEALKYGKF